MKKAHSYLWFRPRYLRRIRAPHWIDVPADLRRTLGEAARCGERTECEAAVMALYDLSASEWAAVTTRTVR